MEPESHRLDREALLGDRRAATERIRREVDEAVAVAAERRRTYLDRFIDRMRFEAHAQQLWHLQQQPPAGAAPNEEAASRSPAAPRVPEEVREASGTREWRDLRARAVPLDALAEREHAAPAEKQERRGPSGRAGAGTRRPRAEAPHAAVGSSPQQLAFDLYGHRTPGEDPQAGSLHDARGEAFVNVG